MFTLWCIGFQNGQTHSKSLATFAANFLKRVWPFWKVIHCRIPLKKSNGIQTIFYLFYNLLNLQCIRFQNDKTHSKKSYNFCCKKVSHHLRTLTLLSKLFVYLIDFQNRLIATFRLLLLRPRSKESIQWSLLLSFKFGWIVTTIFFMSFKYVFEKLRFTDDLVNLRYLF